MFRDRDRQKCLELFDKYYSGRKFHDALYRDAIRRHLSPGQDLLDAGCGRYMKFCKEFSDVVRVIGIDLDSTLDTRNRERPFGARGDLDRLPFAAESFDVVISRSVIEHLAHPEKVFREFYRVLRPGGKVIAITPNKYDYVSVIASVTPYSVHRGLVSKIFRVPEDDVFPTLYRANTRAALQRSFRAAGFVETEIQSVTHYPAYLMFSPLLFRLGVVYERMTSMRLFRSLCASYLCVFEKASGAPARNSTSGDGESERAAVGVA